MTGKQEQQPSRNTLLALAIAACFPLAAPAVPLPQVVERVVRQHPDVQAAQASLRAAEAVITQSRSGFYPELGVSYNAANTRQSQFGVTDDGSPRYGEGVLRWNLFRGNRDSYQVRSSSRQREAAAAELSFAQERVVFEVAEVYAEVVRLRRSLEVARKYIREFEALEQLVTLRVASGKVSSADQAQIRTGLIEARAQAATIQGQLRGAEFRYRSIVGAEAGTLQSPGLRGGEQSLNGLLQAVDESSPRLRAARERAAARGEEVGVARSALYPSIDLELRKRFASEGTLPSSAELDRSAQIGVSLDFPLGGRNRARIDEARAREQQAQAQIESERLSLRSASGDIARQLIEIRLIEPQLRQRVDVTAQLVQAYQLQFEAGKRSVTDLVNAQRERFVAQTSLLDNIHQQFTFQARLLNLSGQLSNALQSLYYDASMPSTTSFASRGESYSSDVTSYAVELNPVPAVATGPTQPIRVASLSQPASQTDAAPVTATSFDRTAPVTPIGRGAGRDEVLTQLQGWVAAWSAKDYSHYRAYYTQDFRGEGQRSTAEWEAMRRKRINKPGELSIELDDMQVRALSEAEIVAEFVQRYKSSNYSDITRKQLVWRCTEQGWRIVRESVRTL